MKKTITIVFIFVMATSVICFQLFSQSSKAKSENTAITKHNPYILNVKLNKKIIEVVGYGTGRAKSPKMSIQLAKMNAITNIAYQAKGIHFQYSKSNGTKTFSIKTKAEIKAVQVKSVSRLANSNYLVIAKATTEINMPNEDGLIYQTATMTSNNLSRIIPQMLKKILETYINQKHPTVTQVLGNAYLSDILVSKPDSTGQFKVSAKFAILIIKKK